MTVQRTGDWARARRLLAAAPRRLEHAISTAVKQEAQLLRTEIVQGITKQAPGGEDLKPPSELTLAARKLRGFGGSKALMVRADLRNSISAIVRGTEAFIGVLRSARSKDGKSLVNVAQVQEYGSDPIIIPMTAAMRRFLFALLKKANQEPKGGSGKGVIVVKVPARPFMRPAFEKFANGAQRRFLQRVARLLNLGV